MNQFKADHNLWLKLFGGGESGKLKSLNLSDTFLGKDPTNQ
jgi:hypothetical protein